MALTTASTSCRHARVSYVRHLGNMFSTWRQRRALERLDDNALEDIGVSKAEARKEAARPIWDAPETWRC